MRLVTCRRRGESPQPEFLGALVGTSVIELAAVDREIPSTMLELLRQGGDGFQRVRESVDSVAPGSASVELTEVELLAPLPRPNSFRDFMLVEEHVLKSFGEVPAEWYEIPVYWKGNCDTIVGPDAVIPWPHYADKLDYELEVAAVLGRSAFRVSPEEAAACIASTTGARGTSSSGR